MRPLLGLVGLVLAAVVGVALVPWAQAGVSRHARSASTGPTKSFHSAPDLHPTVVSVSHDPDTSSGDIFISPDHTQQRGPMILNSAGQLVWFLPVAGKASNFAVQTYRDSGC